MRRKVEANSTGEIHAGASLKRAHGRGGMAEQRLEWNKQSETDSPQGQAHQPYLRREKDSAGGSANGADGEETHKEQKKAARKRL